MIARLPELSSVRSEPSYELVARAIEKQILDGLIAHGDVLPASNRALDLARQALSGL
jgi:DNA-binding transcriptional regulator YhcF (GntR family)